MERQAAWPGSRRPQVQALGDKERILVTNQNVDPPIPGGWRERGLGERVLVTPALLHFSLWQSGNGWTHAGSVSGKESGLANSLSS